MSSSSPSEHMALSSSDTNNRKRENANEKVVWSPTGNGWKDFLFFVGPGWFVSIAYVDPGNYQADIQAGATTRYYLLFCVWWSSILSIYVQILCVRLSYYGQCNLAQVQAKHASSNAMRYLNWAIAEFSTIVTDLPEVIGIGIACNIFFGWHYYVGVLLSLITTMLFLATMNYGINVLEGIVFLFVFIMAVALFVEMSFVGVDTAELMEGWFIGFTKVTSQDIFSISGILGSVVMPHNCYLHTAALQSRKVSREEDYVVQKAVQYSSWETSFPIVFSFFMNMAVVAISAERVYGQVADGDQVGLTDFCDFFKTIKGGCILWGIALLAAGQSSAITTTYTGQYVMDGFLNLQLPVAMRAIVTRLVAITPCVIVSVAASDRLDQMINVVNSLLAFLLPFAFTPLVKYNCSQEVMGQFAAPKWEKYLLYTLCFIIWLINAISFSVEGGGMFGDSVHSMDMSFPKVILIIVEVALQIFYAWWNWSCLRSPIAPGTTVSNEHELQLSEQGLT